MASKAALQPELEVQVQDNDLLQQRKCSMKVWRQVEQVVEILEKDDIHCVMKAFDSSGTKWPAKICIIDTNPIFSGFFNLHHL